jgi:hypothetical protein
MALLLFLWAAATSVVVQTVAPAASPSVRPPVGAPVIGVRWMGKVPVIMRWGGVEGRFRAETA